jgi:hypothetical protein
MRLLECSDAGEFSLTDYFMNQDKIPPYAILSHTWVAGEEVVLEELKNGTGKGKSLATTRSGCAENRPNTTACNTSGWIHVASIKPTVSSFKKL